MELLNIIIFLSLFNLILCSGEKFWNTMMRSLMSIIIFLALFIPNLRSGEKFWNTMMRSLKNIRGDVLDRGRERYVYSYISSILFYHFKKHYYTTFRVFSSLHSNWFCNTLAKQFSILLLLKLASIKAILIDSHQLNSLANFICKPYFFCIENKKPVENLVKLYFNLNLYCTFSGPRSAYR